LDEIPRLTKRMFSTFDNWQAYVKRIRRERAEGLTMLVGDILDANADVLGQRARMSMPLTDAVVAVLQEYIVTEIDMGTPPYCDACQEEVA
jgi:hypothetical protein